jgi:oligosaccharyl transferase (archaeosortase A-associated)
MMVIQNVFKNIITAQDDFRAKLSTKVRLGVVFLLVILSFILFIFKAEFMMRYMVALIPVFYCGAVLAVGAKKALYGTAVFLFFCFALWVRVGPSYNAILGGPVVQFQGNDSEYHVRLIENFVRNFPHRMAYEPYTLYPTGQDVQFAPFFDFLIALFIWIAGLGHPSAFLIEKMSAYYPAVLGALTVIPVYFIGKEIFNNRNAGLIAAGFLAILPGEFLFRSLLGFTDHHIIETLLTTTTMMFLIMAIKRAQELPPTFSNIKNREWTNLKKPLIFSVLAGVMFGCYLLSWNGAALFVFIIFAYFVLQYILDHLKGKSTDYLFLIGLPIFILPIVMNVPFLNLIIYSGTDIAALAISVVVIALLSPLSLIMNRKHIKRIFYPITIVILGAAVVFIIYLTSSSLFQLLTAKFGYLVPTSQSLTIMEAQPFLQNIHISTFFHHPMWLYFTTGTALAAIACLAMFYSAVKVKKWGKWSFISLVGIFLVTLIIWITSFSASIYCRPLTITFLVEALIIIGLYCYFEKSSSRTLLIIWSLVMLICLLSQTRFAYYIAVNIALLSCYALWKIPSVIYKIFQLVGWKEALTQDKNTKASKKGRIKELEEQRAFNYFKPKYVSGFLSIIVIFFLTVYPNLLCGTYDQNGNYKYSALSPTHSDAIWLAGHPLITSSDWYDAMVWMRSINTSTGKLNTPDPFGNDSFYYSLYDKPADGEPYVYPDTAYGVMSWWDYGHWITCIAHRIANANPFQSGIGGRGANGSVIPGASTFLTAQDEAAGSAILDVLGSKYVAIDYLTAGVLAASNGASIFTVIPTWAGQDSRDYYEVWYQQTSDGIAAFMVFYPMYYESMCVRLYNFGAEAAVPSNSTWVLSYTEVTDKSSGQKLKLLNGVANNGSAFATYEDAVKFVQDHSDYTIVGLNPLQSPIPLDALKGYTLRYSSPNHVAQIGSRTISAVEIFEYTDYKH